MEHETVFILLFMIAIAVAIIVRNMEIPYTVALVVTGLVLGLLHVLEPPHLTKSLLFSLFLPGLLFEAAFHIDFKQFWLNHLAVFSLALPGVILATALTALILTPAVNAFHVLQGFTWKYALVFGALISATDPIAVVGVFKSLGVPRRLAVLLNGESLLNDGTAIVFFTLSLALVTNREVTVTGLSWDFIQIVGIGLLIGTAVGFGASQLTKHVDEPMIEITLTTIAAYGSFLVAEQLHYSGVIATVTAGMWCGNYGAAVGMSPSTRIAIETFWEYVAFALNSIVFLLIGFQVNFRTLLESWQVIIVAYLVVTGARVLVIFVVSSMLRHTREKIPWAWSAILTWGGLRGALPMVLALSLAPAFPHRDRIVSMTYGVAIISILVHGLTMSGLLKWLGIVRKQAERVAYEFTRGRLQADAAALNELDHMSHVYFTGQKVLAGLRGKYEQKIEHDQKALEELNLERPVLQAEESKWAARHLLLTEKNEVINSFHHGIISQSVYKRLLVDIDKRLLHLESSKE